MQYWHISSLITGAILGSAVLCDIKLYQSKKEFVADANSAAFSMGVAPIKKGYSDFKRRGVRIRFITEITLENLQYVKELMNYAEVRHMDTVKGNMGVSETEYVATAILEGAKPILEQQCYFLKTFG